MNAEVLKVSLAALIHDIGKMLQGYMEIPVEYELDNSDLFLPFDKEIGRHTHQHAIYTAFFIEYYRNFMPKELNMSWGEGDSFINLAAKHHKPETPFQHIIREADTLSSGHDRVEFEVGDPISVQDVYKTRLLPIFERLLRRDKSFKDRTDFLWEYPLKPLSAQSIFPQKRQLRDRKQAKKEYEELCSSFIGDLKKLCHREHIELWARHFDSLYKIYASHIPSARVGNIIPDVSLYDHSRTTASLAAALYLYHKDTGSLEEKAIKDRGSPKFLLISGDFYGIQKFIFRAGGEERHHRAKLLRGRSFQVSLLTDLAAEFICEKLNLTFLSIVLSAAGKFHIIAPNTAEAKESLGEVKEELTNWFYKNFYGEAGIGIVYTEASPKHFLDGKFYDLWQLHLRHLEEAKYNRLDIVKFGGKVEGYLDSFDNTLSNPLCPLCGKVPSHSEVVNDPYISRRDKRESCSCKLCRDQAYIGTQLVKNKKLAVVKGEGDLKEQLFNKYQIIFLKGCAEPLAKEGRLVKLVELNIDDDGRCPVETEFLPINGYIPVYDEEDTHDERMLAGETSEEKALELIDFIKDAQPKTFYHIAKKALRLEQKTSGETLCYGVPLLASMKADVDNLGAIFACGLSKKLFTLSRLATMSRQLNNFFTLYLPFALKNEMNGAFKEVYTVFAGGDDLFLIGPWNTVMDFALRVHERFTSYACENPQFHLSAGISLHKPHTPVDRIAQESEELLEIAKNAGRNRICVFSQVSTWREFEELKKIKKIIEKWYVEGHLSRSILYKINTLCGMALEERRFYIKNSIPVAKLRYAKWPALLRYYLIRNVPKDVYTEIATQIFKWISTYRGKFFIALWPLLYETRKQKI